MMNVPLPRALDANLQEAYRPHPLTCALTLNSPGVSEAALTLAPDETLGMHQWMELFTQRGSAGLYRVTASARTYTDETQYTLRHGIDTMSDSVYPVQAEEATYTVAQLLANIINYQTARVRGQKPWQLGTCQDTGSVKRAFNYDNLAELLRNLEDERKNYYFTYDFSTFPWTLNFMQKPAGAQCEFRLSRNIESLTVSMDDAELCTQLILSVNVMTTSTPTTANDPTATWPSVTSNQSVIRTYDNAQAQAVWGIVQKTANIDTQDDITAQGFPDADAWAARYMADHSQPTVQIQISGADLYALTGDVFDACSLGVMCRVALPDYNDVFLERVVALVYPDVYGAPDLVNVSLANKLPRFSSAIAQAQQQAASAGYAASTAERAAGVKRGGGGSGGAAAELESWAMIVKKTKESADATGITELYETGIVLDPVSGVRLYSLWQGEGVSASGVLKVMNDDINARATKTTVDALGTRVGQAEIDINAAEAAITLKANQSTVDSLTSRVSSAEIAIDGANAQIALKASQTTVDALGSRVTQAEIDIDGAESAIALKANSVTVDALSTKITNLTTGVTTATQLSTNYLYAYNGFNFSNTAVSWVNKTVKGSDGNNVVIHYLGYST